jgi:hypothetical protein
VLAAAGCGGSAGDLLTLQVSGGAANAHERIRVTEDGRASCNGGALRQLGSDEVLDARQVKRLLRPAAKRGESFRAGRQGGRHYLLRSVDGSVSWVEGATAPAALPRATLFALRLERQLCRSGASTTYG